VPVTISPIRLENSSKIVERSSSRNFWIMTCLKVWAAMRPRASGAISSGSPWRVRVITPVEGSMVQANSSVSRVLKCLRSAETIASSRAERGRGRGMRSISASMLRSRAIRVEDALVAPEGISVACQGGNGIPDRPTPHSRFGEGGVAATGRCCASAQERDGVDALPSMGESDEHGQPSKPPPGNDPGPLVKR
jgi:hypothetical protein